MARGTEERREKLRETLTDIAEASIRDQGLAALRARDLAERAGCSVGAIYTAFDDLEALSMAVNARTFARLGASVAEAIHGLDAGPRDRLIAMAIAYLRFAAANKNLWRAMFDLRMTEDTGPEWYLAEIRSLFAYIAGPLAEIYPDWAPEKRELMVRALFSSIHGICLLGLEKRFSGVPEDRIEEMIALVLSQIA